jgi:hypothetical protein
MVNLLSNMVKIHRKYPDKKWEYRAISTRIKDNNIRKDVIYYTLNNNGKKSQGVEIYQGSNYIIDSSIKSYSRRYNLKDLPEKYKGVIKYAISVHNNISWSKENYVDEN